MTSSIVRLKGLSGYDVQVRGDFVVKVTQGKDSYNSLLASCQKQQAPNDLLLKSVPVLAVSNDDANKMFGFTMPYLKTYKTVWDYEGDLSNIKNQILNSLTNRTQCTSIRSFHIPCYREINRLFSSIDCPIVQTEFKKLSEVLTRDYIDPTPDTSLFSSYHGDFGFGNMLVDELGNIHLIDFEKRFLSSLLMDIATMELSLFLHEGEGKQQLKEIVTEARAFYKQFDMHIKIIMKILILGFYVRTNIKANKEMLLKKYHEL